MFAALGAFISRYWLAVIGAWIAVVALVLTFAPRWDDITYDGDLAYMPDHVSSVRGEHLLEAAFPDGRAKSEVVVVLARNDGPLVSNDFVMADRVAARLHNLLGASAYRKSERLRNLAAQQRAVGKGADADATEASANKQHKRVLTALDEAVRLDGEFPEALHNRALVLQALGRHEPAERDRKVAVDLMPALADADVMLPESAGELPFIDVWTRHTEVVGEKMRSRDKQAQLIVLRLSQEFMATDNIRVLEQIESTLARVQAQVPLPEGLQIGLTGSAAVGADMLRSSAESIKNTELYTIILVVAILLIVYRSPMLVAVPLITIVVSLIVATGLVAALTQMHLIPGMEWWNFKVFTTTKIFVVVILFGAGTDYCLFLISRYREELDAGVEKAKAIGTALHGVGDALAASALTTIVGLGTMFFAQFGKFRNSGPAIGLCLAVTLLACLTLAPALLRAMGGAVFWPFGAGSKRKELNESRFSIIWNWAANVIVTYPGRVLTICTLILLPFAVLGSGVEVTYDMLSELEPSRPSKQGSKMMRRHFSVGETGPLVVLAKTARRDLDSRGGNAALAQLTQKLYVDGVGAVRSLSEPLGDKPKRMSFGAAGRKKLLLRNHRLTRSLYLSQLPEMDGDVARFELVLLHDPFSLEAMNVLNEVSDVLHQESQSEDAYWQGSEFLFSGTTAAIRDLRDVTRADNIQIQILVVLAVLGILLVLLQRPVVCIYLIVSVLFSYLVTIGATELFFRFAYGETFQGLDWKVPLFLFVILVAIGQDYNIYLATRVFEEQERYGWLGGLRRAIVRTGGIITSCGVIMAGTFVSMTTGSLRGIIELGFALSLGVLLDTFVVRPILVPSFLALLFRYKAKKTGRDDWTDSSRPRDESFPRTLHSRSA